MAHSKDISRYPKEFQQLFEVGLTETTELDCGTDRAAISINHKMNAYRRAMEEAQADGHKTCSSIIIRRKGSKLIIEPNNLDIKEILARNKIELKELGPTEEEINARLEAIEKGEQDVKQRNEKAIGGSQDNGREQEVSDQENQDKTAKG